MSPVIPSPPPLVRPLKPSAVVRAGVTAGLAVACFATFARGGALTGGALLVALPWAVLVAFALRASTGAWMAVLAAFAAATAHGAFTGRHAATQVQ